MIYLLSLTLIKVGKEESGKNNLSLHSSLLHFSVDTISIHNSPNLKKKKNLNNKVKKKINKPSFLPDLDQREPKLIGYQY